MTTLNKTYEKRRNFDLRRSLSGVERLIDHLLDFYEKEPAFTFGAVQFLPLQSSVRDNIGSAIIQACSKIKNVVFGILLANDQFITIVRMKKYFIHPCDLHLILNLVHASESLKAAESWTPLCLPHFNEDGYLYSHVSYLAEDCQACLLLLTTDRDVFFALSEAKQRIVEKLRRGNCLEAINESLNTPKETAIVSGFPEIRHYIYKTKSTSQFYQPTVGPPYNINRPLLFMLYKRTQQLLHHGGSPMKLIFEKSPDEAILAWDTKEFELYIIFEPLIDTAASIATVSRLLNWLKKREDRLFQMNQLLF